MDATVREVFSEEPFKQCPELRREVHTSSEERAQTVRTASTKALSLGYWYSHNALSLNI